MRIPLILLVAGVLAVPGVAAAQTDFTAEDIVNHFKAARAAADVAEGRTPAAPKTRGLVIGGDQAGQPKDRGVHFGATGFGNDDEGGEALNSADMTREEAAEAADAAYNLLVTFDLDSDRLTPRARRNLAQFAQALKNPDLTGLRFVVEGHTDQTGPDDYNMSLSERRARAVVRFLTEQGVDPARLEARGFGETRPATPGQHRENRRVETRLVH